MWIINYSYLACGPPFASCRIASHFLIICFDSDSSMDKETFGAEAFCASKRARAHYTLSMNKNDSSQEDIYVASNIFVDTSHQPGFHLRRDRRCSKLRRLRLTQGWLLSSQLQPKWMDQLQVDIHKNQLPCFSLHDFGFTRNRIRRLRSSLHQDPSMALHYNVLSHGRQVRCATLVSN